MEERSEGIKECIKHLKRGIKREHCKKRGDRNGEKKLEFKLDSTKLKPFQHQGKVRYQLNITPMDGCWG